VAALSKATTIRGNQLAHRAMYDPCARDGLCLAAHSVSTQYLMPVRPAGTAVSVHGFRL